MTKISCSKTIRFDYKKLKKLREAKALSLKDLASELEVDFSHVWRIENLPNIKISAELLFRYCDFFGITVLEIMTDEQKKISITNLANYLEFHNVIDSGSAQGMINFYSK